MPVVPDFVCLILQLVYTRAAVRTISAVNTSNLIPSTVQPEKGEIIDTSDVRHRAMCLTEHSSTTDPMEIRTRRIIRRRIFPDGLELPGYRRAQDAIDLHPVRYSHPRSPPAMAPPRLLTIEPPSRPRRRLSSISLPPSSLRSRPLNLRVPFLRRVSRREDEMGTYRFRGRGRSPRQFIVDPPRDIEVRSPQPGSSPPRIQSVSPRRSRSVESRRPEGPTRASDELRTQLSPPTRTVRPPRARTPSPDRERPRRRQTVEVHHDRSTSRGRPRNRSPAVRQVRFASNVEFNENRARNRSLGPEMSNRSRPSAGSTTPRYADVDRSLCRDRHSPARRVRSPVVERRPETARTSPPPRSNRLPPRIIQAGNREIAQQGQSVVEEGRRRRAREGFLHGVSMPWRPSERTRLSRSGSERIVFERTNQQRDGRWQ